MFKLDITLDHAVLRPVARGYVKVAPAPVRTGVSNFLSNLGYMSTIANDIFQARFRDFARDLARLLVNTTVGIGGLFDPAATLGLIRHERDFGQTLGKWGVPTGPYLVLPLLPSDVRDAFGTVPDRFITVDGDLNSTTLTMSLFAARTVDGRAKALPSDSSIDSDYRPVDRESRSDAAATFISSGARLSRGRIGYAHCRETAGSDQGHLGRLERSCGAVRAAFLADFTLRWKALLIRRRERSRVL